MVLRLRKTACPQSGTVPDLDSAVAPGIPALAPVNGFDEPNDPIIEFQHKIIERLISLEYLPCLKPVRVERQWLQDLDNLHNLDRPSDRRQKDHIDVMRKRAVLATDLVGSTVLAVEIKASGKFDSTPLLSSANTSLSAQMGFPTFTDSSLSRYLSNQDEDMQILYAHTLQIAE
jgi:hypothetical protein